MVDTTKEILKEVTQLGARTTGLDLLVQHGSRARGDAHPLSDWDFAFEADNTFDPDAFLADLVLVLHADRVDLVDLDRVGALLRHRVARDGVCLFERAPQTFERFQLDAATTWCDLAPILEAEYERVLERLHTCVAEHDRTQPE
jgi:predicted nucleotidyltransferase